MLNEYQSKLVDAIRRGGTVIGEACPGSGKTRTMEEAVAALINEEICHPSKIGVFTFSRKSAAEARRRIALKILEDDISREELEALENGSNEHASDIFDADPKREMIRKWICTIHGLSYRILKDRGHKIRMPRGKEKWDIEAIVKDGIKELNWDESPKSVWRWVSIGINNMVEPKDSREWFSDKAGLSFSQSENLSSLYNRYIYHMRSKNLVDFDMMQANLVKLIQEGKINLSSIFDYVFIDEAQDNNALQNIIIQALTKESNLVMIGDTDQALYAFRGARPEVLRSIEATRFNLPINYRSTQEIVKASANLIKWSYPRECLECGHSKDEHQSDYYCTGSNPDATDCNCTEFQSFLKPFQYRPEAPKGSEIEYYSFDLFDQLADEIAILLGDEIEDIAILSRTRAECAAIHTALISKGIPAINHSGGLLFGSPHIRKVLAYAMLACNFQDARDNLEILAEIANVASKDFKAPMTRRRHSKNCYAKPWQDCGCPIIIKEGIDYSHARFYGQKAIEAAGNWEGIEDQIFEKNRGGYPSLNSKGATDLVQFVEKIEELKDNAFVAISEIIEESVKPWLMAEDGLSDADLSESSKGEDFQLLLNMADAEDDLDSFLLKTEELSQASQSTSKAINIGTIHWSKGAEFQKVIVNLTRCPLMIPPPDLSKLPTGRPPTMKEERRLAFVAVTRAKEECIVLDARSWLNQELPDSQFIKELGL